MRKKYRIIAAAVAAVAAMGCHFWIEIPVETTVRAQNDMTDLVVRMGNVTTDVAAIDLNGVTIGDVYFSKVRAGSVTGEKVTSRSGSVNVFIASADAITYPFGKETIFSFEDIDPMETDIEEGELNTVIFDENTAEAVISAFAAKKRALQ